MFLASARSPACFPRTLAPAARERRRRTRSGRHHGRLNAVAPRGKNVAELVQHRAEKQRTMNTVLSSAARGPSRARGAEGDPGEEQDEGDVDLDGRPAEA